MEQDITQLEADIAEFTAFKESIDRQQITFPLDKKSIDVMHKDLMVPTGKITYPVDVMTVALGLEAIVNGKRYLFHTLTDFTP